MRRRRERERKKKKRSARRAREVCAVKWVQRLGEEDGEMKEERMKEGGAGGMGR